MQTIVIGHRNPDMDAICSAIGYAELKRKLGMEDVIAARAGNTNERIDFVLGKFGVAAPRFFSDLTPKVADIMETQVVSIPRNSTIYQAISSIEKERLRGLPVVDENNRCLGLLSGWKISQYYFPQREDSMASRRIITSLNDILQALEGQMIAGTPEIGHEELIVMVATMSTTAFSARLKEYQAARILLFVGDREDIELIAIEAGVRAIVMTGGAGVSAKVRAVAKERKVSLIGSRFDTATCVMLARGAVPVSGMTETRFTAFQPDTPLRAARQQAANLAEYAFPVLDGDKQLLGVITKNDFLRSFPRRLILVDHNELGQAVRGAHELEIIEVLDHHRIATFTTDSPILFWNNPVGSTSSIVALCYQQYGVPIDPPIAGLLLAGLVSDTLNLTSPTATPVDAKILSELSAIAGISGAQLAEELFSVGSPLQTLAPKDVIVADCKDYEEGGFRFSVAQIEELSFAHFEAKQADLLAALNEYRAEHQTYFSALLVTDVNAQNSRLLLSAPPEFQAVIHYPSLGPNLYELNNVVSRKKQLVPYLLDCLQRVSPSID
ncbi:MAG: putative manganese-dependent inorganic diphosphatase [Verrucomicrobia bacterium]|nr:putative manganese-dependent inorganic diphosphatase [Verrucomicrobiota bacterium]